MRQLLGADLPVLLDFLHDIYTARDVHALRDGLAGWMVRLIPADVTAYFEADPRRRRVTVTAYPRGAVGTAEEEAFGRSMHQSPLLRSYQRGKGSAVKISDFLTARQFQRLTLFDEFFRPLGLEHQIAKGLPGPPDLVSGIALFRRRRDFNEHDRGLLNLLRPYLNAAYENARLVTEVRDDLTQLRRGLDSLDHGLVMVDAAGRVRLMTTSARAWIAEYFGAAVDGALPDTLRRWVEHEHASFGTVGTPFTPTSPLAVERDGRRLDIGMIRDGDQRVLVLEEQCTAATPRDLRHLGLSGRETEVLTWIAEGKTNAEIATILGISARTVEKHVEHILRRLGVETRTAAAARALAPCDDGRAPGR